MARAIFLERQLDCLNGSLVGLKSGEGVGSGREGIGLPSGLERGTGGQQGLVQKVTLAHTDPPLHGDLKSSIPRGVLGIGVFLLTESFQQWSSCA
jgi:hypothetical protein